MQEREKERETERRGGGGRQENRKIDGGGIGDMYCVERMEDEVGQSIACVLSAVVINR